MQDPKKRNQKGFTLIEIIAVLVILGILAAVAIPKYNDLKVQSANQACLGALGAGVSQAAMSYAKMTITPAAAGNTASVLTRAATDAATYSPLGDFTFTFAVDTAAKGINVTITGATAGTAGADAWAIQTLTDAQKVKDVNFE